MLTFSHLYTGYGRRIVGRDLTATLPVGQLTALFGANGSGKSTLLRTLAGLQPLPRRGASARVDSPAADGATPCLSCNGLDLLSATPRERARLLSVVLTGRAPAEALTVREVVETGRLPYARTLRRATPADREAVQRALSLTALSPLVGRALTTLSDGERQRVFIAKALAQDAPCILLDEPTAFLDFPSKVRLLRLLTGLAHDEGRAVLLSTHDLELTLPFADRLWLLTPDGLTEGTPGALRHDGTLSRFFARQGLRFDSVTGRFDYFQADESHSPSPSDAQASSDCPDSLHSFTPSPLLRS